MHNPSYKSSDKQSKIRVREKSGWNSSANDLISFYYSPLWYEIKKL